MIVSIFSINHAFRAVICKHVTQRQNIAFKNGRDLGFYMCPNVYVVTCALCFS